MAKPLKMTELAQAVEDAAVIVRTGLERARFAAPASGDVTPEMQAIGFRLVLTELLDNQYTRDMP